MSNSRRHRRAAAQAQQARADAIVGMAASWYAGHGALRLRLPLRESTAVLDPPDTDTGPEPLAEAVSNRAWSGFTQADYTPAQWRRACILHRTPADGQDPDAKDLHSLPVREPNGTLNRNGAHAAAARIHATDAPQELKRAAARTLAGLYRDELAEDPPERLLTLAGMAEAAEPPPARQSTALDETVAVALREAPSLGAEADIQIIRAGWNEAGTRYYPADVLARDIPTVFPVGTHMHWDHPTLTERVERPERSLSTLAAVFTETPYTTDGGKTMRVKARVYSRYLPTVREAREDIGVSIHADGVGTYGEAEGRQGLLIEEISTGRSVDFVTRPGAGGRIVALLESAREPASLREARTLGAWLESRLHLALTTFADEMYGDGRLTRTERITLSQAIGDGLGAYTSRIEADAPQLYQRDLYDQPDPAQPESGPGQTQTAAVEADSNVGDSPETEKEKEGDMPDTDTTQVAVREAEEARRKAEQDRETALREAAEARASLARYQALEQARPIAAQLITEANLPKSSQSLLLGQALAAVPLTEAGSFDEPRFRLAVQESITAKKAEVDEWRSEQATTVAESNGAVTGLGSTAPATAPDMKQIQTDLVEAYKQRGLSEQAARLAASGRAF